MRISTIGLLVAISLPMLAAAHVDDPKPAATPSPEPAPAEAPAQREVPGFEAPPIPDGLPIIFDQYHIDLGEVDDAGEVTVGFRFTNTSDKPVKVELLNYCHQCATPEIQPSVVAAGQSGAVIVDMGVHGKNGEIRVAVTVGVAGYPDKPVSLFASAKVVPSVRVSPARIGLGEVKVGTTASEKVKLIIAAPGVTLGDVFTDNTLFTLTTEDEKKVLVNGVERTETPVVVSLLPGAPAGRHEANFTFTTSDPQRIANLNVVAEVMPSLKVEPADVGRGEISPGDLVKRQFNILSRSGDTVRIEGFSLAYGQSQSDPRLPGVRGVRDLSVNMQTQAEGHIVHIELSFVAPDVPGQYRVDARFTGAAAPGDDLVVPIYFAVSR